MRKLLAAIMVAVLALTPLTAHAEINMTWCPDARDEVQLDWFAWTNGRGEIVEERSSIRRIITYAPDKVKAKAYADHITVSADVTTAAPSVVIQWSTDSSFQKNVKTITRKNPKYKGPVYCFLKYDYKCKAGKHDYVADRTFKQGRNVLTYRHLESHNQWDDLAINYQSVTKSRQKVTSVQSFGIPVRYGKKYYVRVCLVYPGTDRKLYSRRVTVKVR